MEGKETLLHSRYVHDTAGKEANVASCRSWPRGCNGVRHVLPRCPRMFPLSSAKKWLAAVALCLVGWPNLHSWGIWIPTGSVHMGVRTVNFLSLNMVILDMPQGVPGFTKIVLSASCATAVYFDNLDQSFCPTGHDKSHMSMWKSLVPIHLTYYCVPWFKKNVCFPLVKRPLNHWNPKSWKGKNLASGSLVTWCAEQRPPLISRGETVVINLKHRLHYLFTFWLCWVFVARAQAFPSCGYSWFWVHGLLVVMTSIIVECGLSAHGLQ